MAELAIFGGPPAFDEPLHVGRPNPGDRARFLARVDEILARNWLTNDGPVVREFEERIRELTGAPHAIAVANGTLGLSLTAGALDLEGEVIMPSFTFVGTAHAIAWLGLEPRFVDVDETSHTLAPEAASTAVGDRTAAILPVHLWGNVCDVEALGTIARDAGIPVFYDAAHALLCGRDGRLVGGFGAAEVFSFHATKFVHAFEGGAVTTTEDDLADRLRLMRNFGFAGVDRVVTLGVNAKMSEVSAAMGLTVLDSVDTIVARNRGNREAYAAAMGPIPGLDLVGPSANDRSNDQYVVVHVDADAAGVDRDWLVEALWAEGVLARRYFTPGCHRSAPYDRAGAQPTLPVTERLCNDVLVLPTGLAVTPSDATVVGELLAQAVDARGRRDGRRRTELSAP